MSKAKPLTFKKIIPKLKKACAVTGKASDLKAISLRSEDNCHELYYRGECLLYFFEENGIGYLPEGVIQATFENWALEAHGLRIGYTPLDNYNGKGWQVFTAHKLESLWSYHKHKLLALLDLISKLSKKVNHG